MTVLEYSHFLKLESVTFCISSFAVIAPPSQVSKPDCRRPGDLLEGARLPKVSAQVPSRNQGTRAMVPLYLTDEESGAPAAARSSSKPHSHKVWGSALVVSRPEMES